MIDLFVYPVSAVMKFWHLIISNAMDDSTAWLLSIVLLVLTVRGMIAPLNWFSIRSGRIGALMRPHSVVLDKELKAAESVESMTDILRKQRDLKESYGYNPTAGCLPSLIMIPFFLGLYRTVLWMARVNDLDHVGVLNREDIASFRTATINGAHITDFAGEHVALITPMLVAAIAFTVISMIITSYRGFLTTRFDEKIARRMFWFMALIIIFIPYLLWNTAVHGPIPVAVILYWGCTYFFTLAQTVIFEILLRRKYPLSEAVHEYRREGIQEWRTGMTRAGRKARRKAKKDKKKAKKDKKKAKKQARKDRRMAKRAARKNRARAKDKANAEGTQDQSATADSQDQAPAPAPTHAAMLNEARKIIKEENKQRKLAKKGKGPKSNSQPEEQTTSPQPSPEHSPEESHSAPDEPQPGRHRAE